MDRWRLAGAGKSQETRRRGQKMVIRVPLIQGFNADEETIKAVPFAADELRREIHFLPYRTLGIQ